MAKFGETRMNATKICTTVGLTSKKNRTMKSFFWEGQFSSGSLVIAGTHRESPRIPTLCLGLFPGQSLILVFSKMQAPSMQPLSLIQVVLSSSHSFLIYKAPRRPWSNTQSQGTTALSGNGLHSGRTQRHYLLLEKMIKDSKNMFTSETLIVQSDCLRN